MILLSVLVCFACNHKEITIAERDFVPLSNTQLPLESSHSQISRNGKLNASSQLSSVYTSTSLDTFSFPIIDESMLIALRRQRVLLDVSRKRYNYHVGNLNISRRQLNETIDILERWQHLIPIGIEEELEAHQLRGDDRKGNVKFTAYFSPIIKVSKRKSSRYKYPILSQPKGFEGNLPSRSEIEKGALDTVTYPLAYATSKADIYYMQLQGSGYVEYPNGKRELLSYDGENNHPYRSIETYLIRHKADFGIRNASMEGIKKFISQYPNLADTILNQNPSFTFFRRGKKLPTGAGLVPLSEDISIAVDKRYIPLGSCLLAAVPVVNEQGVVTHHEYKILVAQDVGGAIKGTGHVDLYFGAGKEAQARANSFNHYGRLWLLLPKKENSKQDYAARVVLANYPSAL
ncbi:MAG: murein transglycosylase A [Bacteroidota bacterium]